MPRALLCCTDRHARPADFIRANTSLLPVPLVPEIRLHLAEESLPIWQKTEEELGRMNVPPPWWAFAWAGGQALARYVLDNPGAGRRAQRARPRRRLGPRRPSPPCKAGAARVLAADTDPFALAAIALNAEANGVAIDDHGATICWPPRPPPSTLVLVGDLFYERRAGRAGAGLRRGRAGAGADVLVGDPRRSYFPKERFRQVAEYSVPVTRDLEDMEIKHTAVWRLA